MPIRPTIIYLLLSITIILFASFAQSIIVYIDIAYAYINILVTPLFMHLPYGSTVRNISTLMLLPFLIAGIPALVYKAIKKRPMPYFFEAMWTIWLVIALSKILVR